MTDYRDQLTGALRAIAITSPTSYSWFGRRSRPLPAEVSAALTADASREYLASLLERELYRSFYTRGHPVPASLTSIDSARPDRTFVEALSGANKGVGGWEAGWQVEASDPPFLLMARNALRVRVPVVDCDPPGAGHAPGAKVRVRRPKEFRETSPGFYTALGNIELAPAPEEPEVRVYFNVTPRGAVPLVSVCTRLLNEAKLPFELKVADHPARFARCDPAVLYLTGEGYDHVRATLDVITPACTRHLRPEVPAFTKQLVPGVAVGAHRTQLGHSFGSSRCRLVAEGLIAARECGADGLSKRLDAVARRFADNGLDIEAPYLAPGSDAGREL